MFTPRSIVPLVAVLALMLSAAHAVAESCCDKAKAAGKTCTHPCCVAEAKVNSVCFKCNPGATAEPFNGTSLDAWKTKGNKTKWVVGEPKMSTANNKLLESAGDKGALINLAADHGDSVDIFSEAKFGDCRIELEVMVPKGSNSGIYVMGEYEIQVLDSYGKTQMGMGDMGAIYGAAPPRVNACKAPGEWQKYVIDFKAPRFDENGQKIGNAVFTRVELNGKVIQENAEMKGPTPGGLTGKEAPKGPLMFQGDHGPVAYRNIRITDTSK